MRLLLAAEIFPPDIGGPATYTKQVAEFFTKDQEKVVVFCYADFVQGHQPQNYQIIRISRNTGVFARYCKYFWALLKETQKGDIIYAQGSTAGGFPALLVHFIKRNRFVLRVGGDYTWEQAMNFGLTSVSIDDFEEIPRIQTKSINTKLKFYIMRKMQCAVARGADNIIVASEYLKSLVVKWGVSPEKIIVIPSSFTITDITATESKEFYREKLGWGGAGAQKSFVLLSVGRFVSWKGFDTLIELMPAILQKIPHAKLYILGEGPDFDRCFAIAEFTGLLNKNIFLPGKIEHNLLKEYYKASDVFILNSGYEGLSHILVEVMSNGTPIIASNIGGNTGLIKHKENGLLAAYNNKQEIEKAIIDLYSDKQLFDLLVKNEIATSKSFQFSNSSALLKKVIHNV